MTIQERYEQLKADCNNRERIFKHVGVPKNDGSGGWTQRPRIDVMNGGIPLIEKFAIMPKTAQQRLNDLRSNGWQEFVIEPAPQGIKPVASKVILETETKKPTRRRTKSK